MSSSHSDCSSLESGTTEAGQVPGQPRFPMEICDRTFELVAEQLSALNYMGPVGLSCDDTKLLSVWRLYWDAEQNAHFLVGGVHGPCRVANPDQVKEVIANENTHKATKVRLWCLTIPAPKMTPLIVAAIPIGDDLDAGTLLSYLERVLHGLLERKIQVVSYACEGTEIERSVQKLLVGKAEDKIEHTIKNPNSNSSDTHISIAVIQGQPICMIQDARHALKTFRNNLFSGARLLTLGNHTAIFRRIREMAFAANSPIYRRDVDRLDRQDDHTVLRLFSAAVLEFLSDHHHVGEIIYLFVFGELIDAYLNQSISHHERLKLVLRTHYFLDSWETFLNLAGYKKSQYCLSHEAMDMARIIIQGYISLVFVHRDHAPCAGPLLPWLHSVEACKHVFGEARHVAKDLTLLDFEYMVPTISIRLHQAILRALSLDPEASANGDCHTYFDHTDINLRTLATYPTDEEIGEAARDAAREADNLIASLGICRIV